MTTVSGQRQRDKQRTRERISQHAMRLFLARGFDEVTVADVAAGAGVSKVTVFAHFPRKEDLLLDLAPEAVRIVQGAVLDRPDGVEPLGALRSVAFGLASERHPLSGLANGAEPFLRTISSSPALIGRAWELLNEVEVALADALADTTGNGSDGGEDNAGSPRLLSAMVVAAYRTVVTDTVGQVLQGVSQPELTADHHRRLGEAFDALQRTVTWTS